MSGGYWYIHTAGYPVYGSQSSSINDGNELALIQAGFDKFPTPTGFPNAMLTVKADGTAYAFSAATLTSAGVMAGLIGITSTGTVNLTGATTTVATAPFGDNSNNAANTAFVSTVAMNSALPGQTGKGSCTIKSIAGSAYWTPSFNEETQRAIRASRRYSLGL